MTPRAPLAAAAAALLSLAACGTPAEPAWRGFEGGWAGTTGTLHRAGSSREIGLVGPRLAPPEESLTVARVRAGAEFAPDTLRSEDGDVWPREEAPRATLANPEAALRDPPPFRENEPRPVARRGSASPPPPPLESLAIPAEPPPRRDARPVRPLPPREDGQVIFTPSGPATTTGGSGNVRSTISPQGPGIAIQQGGTTTIIGPGGQTQVVPTPR